jgi:hypothetical protein
MAKKSRKHHRNMDFDAFDDFEDSFDDDYELHELSIEYDSDDDWNSGEGKFTARRKIERRKDMKKLYSQLDEWEEFGSRTDW